VLLPVHLITAFIHPIEADYQSCRAQNPNGMLANAVTYPKDYQVHLALYHLFNALRRSSLPAVAAGCATSESIKS
jgi:hypothetical protein